MGTPCPTTVPSSAAVFVVQKPPTDPPIHRSFLWLFGEQSKQDCAERRDKQPCSGRKSAVQSTRMGTGYHRSEGGAGGKTTQHEEMMIPAI